ncbi:unnamed protein product, partial [marine sediment metagenome]
MGNLKGPKPIYFFPISFKDIEFIIGVNKSPFHTQM